MRLEEVNVSGFKSPSAGVCSHRVLGQANDGPVSMVSLGATRGKILTFVRKNLGRNLCFY